MNLDDPRHPWTRLTAGARSARDERETAAPFGFATRLSALAFGRKPGALVERLALRALGLACLLAVLSAASNFSEVRLGSVGGEAELAEDDPVVLLLGD